MSIDIEIELQIKAGKLFRLPSLLCGDDTPRTMYVSLEILEAVAGPFDETREGERLVEFRQTLDAFLEDGEFSVAEDPYTKPSDAMLARVDPVTAEIWDIRSIVPTPGIRALGGFAKFNTFVALTWDYRENLETAEDWRAEINRCRENWRNLFGDKPPFKGASLNEYLSNNYPV